MSRFLLAASVVALAMAGPAAADKGGNGGGRGGENGGNPVIDALA